jgi:hypothetical protein
MVSISTDNETEKDGPSWAVEFECGAVALYVQRKETKDGLAVVNYHQLCESSDIGDER